RSNAWWAAWAHRLVRGREAVPHTELAAGELKWLVAYAPLSWVYRLVLLFALIGWAGSRSWLLGWLAAVVLLGWMALRGAASMLRLSQGTARYRLRAAGGLAVLAAAAGVALFAVPAPNAVVARGVVWPPERAQLRPEVAGFVATTPVADGARVAAGDVLLTLAELALRAELDRRASQLAGLQAQQYQALLQDPAKASDLAQDITRNEAEIERAEQQLAQLEVRGQVAGRLVLPKPGDLPGSYAARGAMLGYILGDGPANVRAVLDEQDVLLVRNRVRSVEVRLADLPARPLVASLEREMPGATRALPSAALGERRGGPFAVDPADKEGLRTLAPVFLMDVAVPGYPPGRIGARAWVRFDLGYEPLGLQWLRRARQLLLREFNPVGQP
ncbi:MAG: biotin/lipoyl-binding protein, partial [Ramlibacter sp.]